MKRRKPIIKVLVVDDNDAYRDGLVEFLIHEMGIQVVGEAGGGDQAIDLAALLNPDLVLMDISMPGTNGLQAARIIKERSPRTKVIFVTIHQEETYRAIGELMGADGFVTKNFVKEGLRTALRKIHFSLSAA